MVASTASDAWSATPPAATATRWATGWAASVTRSITGSAAGTLGAGLRTASMPPVTKIVDRRGRAMRRTIMGDRFPARPGPNHQVPVRTAFLAAASSTRWGWSL